MPGNDYGGYRTVTAKNQDILPEAGCVATVRAEAQYR